MKIYRKGNFWVLNSNMLTAFGNFMILLSLCSSKQYQMLLPNGSHPWDTEFNTGINLQMVPKVEQSAVLPFFNTAYRGITNQ